MFIVFIYFLSQLLQSRHTTYRESTFCLGIDFLKKIVKFRWLMVHKNQFFLKSTKKWKMQMIKFWRCLMSYRDIITSKVHKITQIFIISSLNSREYCKNGLELTYILDKIYESDSRKIGTHCTLLYLCLYMSTALLITARRHSTIKLTYVTSVKLPATFRAQSFTSLMADLRQDINRVSSFSRCLNGTF